VSGPKATYIFAGGGTGGHLTPALAVAASLRRLQGGARVLFLCTDKPIDQRFLAPTGWGMVRQPVRALPRRPWRMPGFAVRWWRSVAFARRVIRDVRPAAVLGLGGYAAGPAARVAAGKVPTAMLNPDAVPGKANRYLARRVDAIFTQFEATADHFDAGIRSKVTCLGCPVRQEILGGDRDAACANLGLDPGKRTLAVMGGSLGAETVNQAVVAAADLLASHADRWQVFHITGPDKSAAIEGSYREMGVAGSVMDFCDRMGQVYVAADVMICRGGANTVAELTATATPGVIMPYPFHADDHQVHNAAAMLDVGAALLVRDTADVAANAADLREALSPILADADVLPRMAAAAASLGRADAAEAVARWLIDASVASA